MEQIRFSENRNYIVYSYYIMVRARSVVQVDKRARWVAMPIVTDRRRVVIVPSSIEKQAHTHTIVIRKISHAAIEQLLGYVYRASHFIAFN